MAENLPYSQRPQMEGFGDPLFGRGQDLTCHLGEVAQEGFPCSRNMIPLLLNPVAFRHSPSFPFPRSSQWAPGRAAGFCAGPGEWLQGRGCKQGRTVHAAAVGAVSAPKPVLFVVS